MRKEYLVIIKEVGFDFEWDNKKVWALDIPVTTIGVQALEWHFDIPFLKENNERYSLTPREVLENPQRYQQEYQRALNADPTHPLDLMENKGRLLMLDGLHRLMKLYLLGEKTARARIMPREKIPDILK